MKNPYGENVVHDPKHPYWVVSRSRAKCRWYNAPPLTNADRIRAMSDEELRDFLQSKVWLCETHKLCDTCTMYDDERGCLSVLEWLKQPAEQQDGNDT